MTYMRLGYMYSVDKMAAKKRSKTATTGVSRSRDAEGDAERAFLAEYDVAAYERPSLTVDIVLLTLKAGAMHALFVRRADHPCKGAYALPGGFVGMREDLDTAAARVLATKCGLRGVFVEQLFTFGRVDRDPRTRVVSVAYFALVETTKFERAIASLERAELLVGRIRPSGDIEDATGKRVAIAFDHDQIVATAIERLRGKLDYAPVGYQLLPDRFTLFDLQEVHETVLGHEVNKDSFRRRMLASGDLVALGELQKDVGHRPAELYRFARRSAV